MINEVKFYLILDKQIENITIMEKMFSIISENKVTITKKNCIYEVSGVDEKGFINLSVSLKPLQIDLKCDVLSFVVVPCFHKEFESIINVKENKVYYLLDLLIEKQNEINIKQLSKIFEKVNKTVLLTIKNYICLNHSVLSTSEIMFTHRNTINYRINKFINLTGINVRDINNSMVVYYLLNILHI